MKVEISDYETNEIVEIIRRWAPKKSVKIRYFDDLIKIANEHGIAITIEKQ